MHAEYFCDLLTASAENGAPVVHARTDLAFEIENIRSALVWAFGRERSASIEVALAAASAPVWLELSLLNECADWMRKALARIDAGVRGTRRDAIASGTRVLAAV